MWFSPWCQETEPGTCPRSSEICRRCSGGSLTTECLCPETHNTLTSHLNIRRLNTSTFTNSHLLASRHNTVISASTINKRLLDVYRSDLTLVTTSSTAELPSVLYLQVIVHLLLDHLLQEGRREASSREEESVLEGRKMAASDADTRRVKRQLPSFLLRLLSHLRCTNPDSRLQHQLKKSHVTV